MILKSSMKPAAIFFVYELNMQLNNYINIILSINSMS